MPATTLYALIIGINDYPIRAHRLQGCVPDAEAMHDFLARVCVQESIDYQPAVLLNDKATLERIIQGFDHFEQASDGDICVLYYSGHGSQMNSPREFWQIDTDRLLETMVCYDSRLPGGRDLTDKELSYLIWRSTKKNNKDIHFLSIFDCCHSGTITRGVAEEPAGGLTSRMADKNPNSFGFSDLAGHKEYIRLDNGAIRPPLGDYVTISAAQSHESAYEMSIGGMPRGIFTNALLDVLEKTNLKYLSYGDLVSRVYTRVQNRTNAQTPQHPQVNVYGQASAKGLFLNGSMSKSPRSYVKYDEKEGWIVDLGSIHGLRRGARLTVDVNGQEKGLQARVVRPGRSIVEPEGHLDRDRQEYLIRKIDLKPPPLVIGVDPAVDAEARNHIETAVKTSKKLELDQATAKYWAKIDQDRGYILTRPGEEMPVFKGVRMDVPEPAGIFIDNVEKVAHWEYVSELVNPVPSVNINSWLDIELLEVVEHQDYLNVVKAESKSIDEEAIFSYQYRHGQWMEPALQLRVKNKSRQSLWIAGLYLSEDFSITDLFMPVREVRPGEEPYSFADESGNDIIALWLPDEIYSWGGTEIINRIKIIASSERFDVTDLCQEGLELEHRDLGFRGATRGARPGRNTPKWATKDIQLRIVRPLEAEPLTAGRDLRIHKLTIEGHDGLSAKGVSLASSKEAARSIGHGAASFGVPEFTDINLASSRDAGKPLDVIELSDVEGAENVDAEHPLKLKVGAELPPDTSIIPFGRDAETGLYFPLGYTDKEGMVRIEQMPDTEEGRQRGFVQSFKIYLKGVWFEKVLGTEKDHSVLAVATVKDEQSDTEYVTDIEEVTRLVGEARNILLFVHGWMGDTQDKVKVVRRIKKSVDGQTMDLMSVYDLVLTFHYDSLGQTLDASARQLKTSLEAVGFGPEDGKTLDVVAHSLGGLVTRWMVEKEGGDQLADHLIMAGCPNLGTPWAGAYDVAVFGLTKLLNFLPFPGTLKEALGFLGKVREGMDEAIRQMRGDSDWMRELNQTQAAPIPYTVIAGDTGLLERDEREEKLLRRYLDRFKGAYRSGLEAVLFGEPNDDIVSLRSMQGLEGARIRMVKPVGSSHLTYFVSEEGVRVLGEALWDGEKGR